MHQFCSVLFVFFGQYPWNKNMNGFGLFKVRRCCLFSPLNTIGSRQFSFDRSVALSTAASSVTHFSGFDVKYKDCAEQCAVGKIVLRPSLLQTGVTVGVSAAFFQF